MTIETPFHVKRVHLEHQGHLVHTAVTAGAANAFPDVDAVVEIDKIGEVMYAGPSQRLPGLQAGTHGFQHFRIGPQLRMTPHTNVR